MCFGPSLPVHYCIKRLNRWC